MKKKSKLIALFVIAFLGSACTNSSIHSQNLSDNVVNQFVSSLEINVDSRSLQKLNDSFEASPDGPTLNQTIEVFEINNGECLSLVTLYNESGFGGYEDLLIFKDNQVIVALQRNLTFSTENKPFTKNNIKYDNVVDNSKETQHNLKKDFERYSKNFNSKVISSCK